MTSQADTPQEGEESLTVEPEDAQEGENVTPQEGEEPLPNPAVREMKDAISRLEPILRAPRAGAHKEGDVIPSWGDRLMTARAAQEASSPEGGDVPQGAARGRYSWKGPWDLAMHLVGRHADPLALHRPERENEESHHGEHTGPGTVRDHDEEDMSYEPRHAREVLREAGMLPPPREPEADMVWIEGSWHSERPLGFYPRGGAHPYQEILMYSDFRELRASMTEDGRRLIADAQRARWHPSHGAYPPPTRPERRLPEEGDFQSRVRELPRRPGQPQRASWDQLPPAGKPSSLAGLFEQAGRLGRTPLIEIEEGPWLLRQREDPRLGDWAGTSATASGAGHLALHLSSAHHDHGAWGRTDEENNAEHRAIGPHHHSGVQDRYEKAVADMMSFDDGATTDYAPVPHTPHAIGDLGLMAAAMHREDPGLGAAVIAVDLAWVKTADWPWHRRLLAGVCLAFNLTRSPSTYLKRRSRRGPDQ